MNIVLIGYMGSGKSLVGSHLAKKIDYKFIDLDQYIEKNEGSSISKIFEDSGDIYFRKIETKYLIKCLSEPLIFIMELDNIPSNITLLLKPLSAHKTKEVHASEAVPMPELVTHIFSILVFL